MPKNPHANFTPTLEGYSGQGAFRFWCQTALPLTYDDSLSYYELLAKVVNYLNNTISDVSAMETNVENLAEAYEKLQKYVNDYFDDLDIEAELRNVLDAMAEDGTLDSLLDPLVADHLPGVVEDQIDAVVGEQIDAIVAGQIDDVVGEQLPPLVNEGIPSEVTDWLNENVTPVGSAVVVDSSLTISGAAADAKVTGDKLTVLNDELNAVEEALSQDVDAEQTTVNNKYVGQNGGFGSSTDFVTYTFPLNGAAKIRVETGNYSTGSRTAYTCAFSSEETYDPANVISVKDAMAPETANAIYEYVVPNGAKSAAICGSKSRPEGVNAPNAKLIFYNDVGEIADSVDNLIIDVDNLNYKLKQTQDIKSQFISGGYIDLSVGVGNTVDVTPVNNSGWDYIIVPCRNKDVFTLKGSGGNSPRLWGFCNNEYKLLSVANPNVSNLDGDALILTATSNGYFVCNTQAPTRTTLSINTVITPATVPYVINLLNEETNPIYEKISILDYYGTPEDVSWVIGGIASSGAGQLALKYMLRTKTIVEIQNDGYIQGIEGHNIRVFWYTNKDDGYTSTNLIRVSSYTTSPVELRAGDKIGVVVVDPDETVQTDLSMIQFVEWRVYLHNIRDVVDELSTITSPFYRNIAIRKADVATYYWGLASDYSTVRAISTTKYAEIIAHYDALMANYPDYITRNSIGTGSGTDEQGNTYTLYEYVFKPRHLTNDLNQTIMPKILLDAGIHGFEKNAVSALYYFMQDICENWEQNPSLTALRWGVEFHVIPISNPHGFDNNNYYNANGVNLARNFPCEGWEPVYTPATQVNGEAPLDQPEAQAIANMISENEDAFLYLNLHTNGQTDVTPSQSNNIQLKTGVNDDYYNRQFQVATYHIEHQSALIPTRYASVELPSTSFIGRFLVTSESKKGQVDTYCVEWLKLMMASVFEVYNGMIIDETVVVTGRSPDSIKMCSEMIGNYILDMLYEYGK